MVQVGIIMGSDSDLPVMSEAAKVLDSFGIEYELTIVSAHRTPEIGKCTNMPLQHRKEV